MHDYSGFHNSKDGNIRRSCGPCFLLIITPQRKAVVNYDECISIIFFNGVALANIIDALKGISYIQDILSMTDIFIKLNR